jgi:hypothetical protein
MSLNSFSQAASKVNNAQNVWTINHDPAVLLECDPILSGIFRPRIKDSIYWETYNIIGLESYIQGIGDIRFKSISYSPTYGEIVSSLGYTPYNNTNPAGYISAFTEVDPIWLSVASSYRTKVQNDLLYQPIGSYLTSETDPLFNTKFASKSTTDLTEGTNLYYTNTRARLSLSAGVGISYNSGTGVITNSAPNQTVVLTGANNFGVDGTYPSFTLTQYVKSDNTVTRTINSSTYTISSTKIATVKYNIKIVCTATIGSASSGKVLFQYSTDGGSNWIDAGEVENSNTVTLAIVLNSTTTQSGFIVWNIPANALCRLVPTTSGTTTITWIRGQESY